MIDVVAVHSSFPHACGMLPHIYVWGTDKDGEQKGEMDFCSLQRSFLHLSYNCGEPRLFDTPLGRAVLQFKWEAYGRRFAGIQLAVFITHLFCVCSQVRASRSFLVGFRIALQWAFFVTECRHWNKVFYQIRRACIVDDNILLVDLHPKFSAHFSVFSFPVPSFIYWKNVQSFALGKLQGAGGWPSEKEHANWMFAGLVAGCLVIFFSSVQAAYEFCQIMAQGAPNYLTYGFCVSYPVSLFYVLYYIDYVDVTFILFYQGSMECTRSLYYCCLRFIRWRCDIKAIVDPLRSSCCSIFCLA